MGGVDFSLSHTIKCIYSELISTSVEFRYDFMHLHWTIVSVQQSCSFIVYKPPVSLDSDVWIKFTYSLYACYCCPRKTLSNCHLENKAPSFWPQESFSSDTVLNAVHIQLLLHPFTDYIIHTSFVWVHLYNNKINLCTEVSNFLTL